LNLKEEDGKRREKNEDWEEGKETEICRSGLVFFKERN